jgi:hypothetical protein
MFSCISIEGEFSRLIHLQNTHTSKQRSVTRLLKSQHLTVLAVILPDGLHYQLHLVRLVGRQFGRPKQHVEPDRPRRGRLGGTSQEVRHCKITILPRIYHSAQCGRTRDCQASRQGHRVKFRHRQIFQCVTYLQLGFLSTFTWERSRRRSETGEGTQEAHTNENYWLFLPLPTRQSNQPNLAANGRIQFFCPKLNTHLLCTKVIVLFCMDSSGKGIKSNSARKKITFKQYASRFGYKTTEFHICREHQERNSKASSSDTLSYGFITSAALLLSRNRLEFIFIIVFQQPLASILSRGGVDLCMIGVRDHKPQEDIFAPYRELRIQTSAGLSKTSAGERWQRSSGWALQPQADLQPVGPEVYEFPPIHLCPASSQLLMWSAKTKSVVNL